MEYNYTVNDIYGNTVSCTSFREAVSEAKKLLQQRKDCDPVIDQYFKGGELTGKYWLHRDGNFVEPPTLDELLGRKVAA